MKKGEIKWETKCTRLSKILISNLRYSGTGYLLPRYTLSRQNYDINVLYPAAIIVSLIIR